MEKCDGVFIFRLRMLGLCFQILRDAQDDTEGRDTV